MDNLTYKSISARSGEYSDYSKTLFIKKQKTIGRIVKIISYIITLIFSVPFVLNIVMNIIYGTVYFNFIFIMIFLFGLLLSIAVSSYFRNLKRGIIEKMVSFAKQCNISIDSQGISGNMINYVLKGNVLNTNLRKPEKVDYVSFIYRQIENVELDGSDIVIHTRSNQYVCPNIPDVKDVFNVIQNNLRIYDGNK